MKRKNQKNRTVAEKGLAKHLAKSKVAGVIGRSHWMVDEYRKIYNKCCGKCKALIIKTGGRATFKQYCSGCQVKAKPHLQNIKVMLGDNYK